jgi:hypothetical protein
MIRWALFLAASFAAPTSFPHSILHNAMTTFFLRNRNLIRLQWRGHTANPDFPLTPETVHHFERLTGYFLSFFSGPFQMGIAACASFIGAYFFSLSTIFCFRNRPGQCESVAKVRWFAIFVEILFLVWMIVSIYLALSLYAVFPDYSMIAATFVREINETIEGMRIGIREAIVCAENIESDLEVFSAAFSEGGNLAVRLGIGLENGTFDLVRSAFGEALEVGESIAELAQTVNLSGLAMMINRAVPGSLQCRGRCVDRLRNYRRDDVFDMQLNQIFECIDHNEQVRTDCLDQFEEATISFLEYWTVPLELHDDLITQMSDWPDIGAPRVYSLIALLQSFGDRLTGDVREYFENEFAATVTDLRALIIAIPVLSFVLLTPTLSWFFVKGCWVAVFSIANSINVIVYAVVYGILLSHVVFLETAMIAFDVSFQGTVGVTQATIVYGMFECPTTFTGSSMNFAAFTSGSEFAISELMERIHGTLVDEIYVEWMRILEPITYFAVNDGTVARLPYYTIEDAVFDRLFSASIMNDPSIPAFPLLYNVDPMATEQNIIESHRQASEVFRLHYDQLFDENGTCMAYRLPYISDCPVDHNDTAFQYLVDLQVTAVLRNDMLAVQAALREFSREGKIYPKEFELVNLMSLIVKNYLYQISNGLVAVFSAISSVYNDYTDFIRGSNGSFHTGRTGLLRIVNGSCVNVAVRYHEMREQVMLALPESASILFLMIWITLILSFLIALLTFVFKVSAGDRSGDWSEEHSSMSRSLPEESSSSSSAPTFSDKQSINPVPRATTDDESSSFSDLRPALPFRLFPYAPPPLNIEFPSLPRMGTDSGPHIHDFEDGPLRGGAPPPDPP